MKRILFSLMIFGCVYTLGAYSAKAECKNFAGRPNEKICQTKPDYEVCRSLVKQGSVNVCILAGDKSSYIRRATFAEAMAALKDKNCTKTGTTAYVCEENIAYSQCFGYKNFFALMEMKNSRVTECLIKPKEKPGEAAKQAGGAKFTTVPLYHFYELQKDNFHFYSANPDEVAALKKQPGWKYVDITGYIFTAKVADTTPLYRLVKAEFGGTNHLYTVDMNEANNAVQNAGWTAEGVAGYIATKQLPGTVPLYRFYLGCQNLNDGKFKAPCEDATGGDVHYYTASGEGKITATYNGMTFVRIEGYVWAKPTSLQ